MGVSIEHAQIEGEEPQHEGEKSDPERQHGSQGVCPPKASSTSQSLRLQGL